MSLQTCPRGLGEAYAMQRKEEPNPVRKLGKDKAWCLLKYGAAAVQEVLGWSYSIKGRRQGKR